jgi:hypothetical protein
VEHWDSWRKRTRQRMITDLWLLMSHPRAAQCVRYRFGCELVGRGDFEEVG